MSSFSGRLTLDDLSTRARLREAAVARFGRDGFDASLRAIAADVGLSAASVIKHFGSKEQLQAECDKYVFDTIRDSKRAVIADPASPTVFLAQMARRAEYGPLVAYVIRSLQAGGEHARQFVDQLVADAVDYIAEGVEAGTFVPSRDEVARARFLVEATLGALTLEMTLNPQHDPNDLSGNLLRFFDKLTLPALELYSEGLFTDRRMLDNYLLYVGDPPGDAEDSATAAPTRDQENDNDDVHRAERSAARDTDS